MIIFKVKGLLTGLDNFSKSLCQNTYLYEKKKNRFFFMASATLICKGYY